MTWSQQAREAAKRTRKIRSKNKQKKLTIVGERVTGLETDGKGNTKTYYNTGRVEKNGYSGLMEKYAKAWHARPKKIGK